MVESVLLKNKNFSPSHFDYLNPNSMSGSIILNVFDEVDQIIQNKDVKMRNWMGSLAVPLSAICSNNGVSNIIRYLFRV